MLGTGSAECVYGTMMWNEVDEIFHKGTPEVEAKFGDDRTKFQHTVSDFPSAKEQKTRPTGMKLRLVSVWMEQYCGIKLTESSTRVSLMLRPSLVKIALGSNAL